MTGLNSRARPPARSGVPTSKKGDLEEVLLLAAEAGLPAEEEKRLFELLPQLALGIAP